VNSVVEYGARRTAVVAAVMLASLMLYADMTIVNVALPSIDGALGASTDEGAWFVTAYIIASVIVIPLSPWLQTMFGRKNFFLLAIAGFTISSVLCGLANDTSTEIGLRFLQGIFGGGLAVPAQQILRDTFPPAQLATSQSLFSLALVLGPTIGPTLGGILTDDLTWRWVYFVNVPAGIAATILVLLFVRDPEKPKRIPFDLLGVTLLAIGLGTMQYVLDEGERNGWFDDSLIMHTAIVSVIALVAFALWELFGARTPAVALRTFRLRNVWTISISYFLVACGIFAFVFIQPIWAQNTLGFTTTLAGMLLMARAATVVALFPLVRWVTSRPGWDMRWVAAAATFVAGLAAYLQCDVMTTQSSFEALLATQMLSGVGLAFVWTPLAVLLFQTIPPAETPAALALTRLIQQIGGSFGAAIAATLLDRDFDGALSSLAGSVNLHSAPVATYVMQHGSHAIGTLYALVANEAQNLAAVDASRFFAVAMMLAAAAPLLLKRHVQAKRAVLAVDNDKHVAEPATHVNVPARERVA
jgi:MFS transporter, DHA2 family, multidrug resistance protein